MKAKYHHWFSLLIVEILKAYGAFKFRFFRALAAHFFLVNLLVHYLMNFEFNFYLTSNKAIKGTSQNFLKGCAVTEFELKTKLEVSRSDLLARHIIVPKDTFEHLLSFGEDRKAQNFPHSFVFEFFPGCKGCSVLARIEYKTIVLLLQNQNDVVAENLQVERTVWLSCGNTPIEVPKIFELHARNVTLVNFER